MSQQHMGQEKPGVLITTNINMVGVYIGGVNCCFNPIFFPADVGRNLGSMQNIPNHGCSYSPEIGLSENCFSVLLHEQGFESQIPHSRCVESEMNMENTHHCMSDSRSNGRIIVDKNLYCEFHLIPTHKHFVAQAFLYKL